MTKSRPRVTCPVCQREVALTPRGKIGWHKDPTSASAGYYCDGYGNYTAADAEAMEVQRLAELIARYPERARELVAQLPRT